MNINDLILQTTKNYVVTNFWSLLIECVDDKHDTYVMPGFMRPYVSYYIVKLNLKFLPYQHIAQLWGIRDDTIKIYIKNEPELRTK